MGTMELQRAYELIDTHRTIADFAGPKDESLVDAAQNILGVSFPPTYLRFLLDLGAGNFGYAEIYGVIDEDFTAPSVPDAIWLTLRDRIDFGLPQHLVHILDVGDGTSFFIDTGTVEHDGECPVVSLMLSYPLDVQQPNIVEADFGKLLLRVVQEVIRARSP